MELYEAEIDGKLVALLYEGEGRPCHLYVGLPAFDVVVIDVLFPNPVKASAELRCTLGYGPACDFLHQFSVPYESQLWHLNHDGPPNGTR